MKSAAHCLLLVMLTISLHASAQAEIQVWHGYRAAERAGLEKVVEAFNAARASSGVKVTLRAIPSDAFTDKISAAVPQGIGPDVFVFPQDRLGGWVESGNMLEPLDFLLEGSVSPGTRPWRRSVHRPTAPSPCPTSRR